MNNNYSFPKTLIQDGDFFLLIGCKQCPWRNYPLNYKALDSIHLQASLERVLWCLIFVGALYGLSHHLSDAFKENRKSQGSIVTRIGLRTEGDVPFPGLVINVGRPIDPLGFVRKSKDMVTWEDLQEEGI